MTPEAIRAAARDIFKSLTDEEREYARSESQRRTLAGDTVTETPFSCLHDMMDANERLPEGSIIWDAEGGPDCTDANSIMDAFNELFEKPVEPRLSLEPLAEVHRGINGQL